MTIVNPVFCSCDLDLEPMILIHELHRDILHEDVHAVRTKNALSNPELSKVTAPTADRRDT